MIEPTLLAAVAGLLGAALGWVEKRYRDMMGKITELRVNQQWIADQVEADPVVGDGGTDDG